MQKYKFFKAHAIGNDFILIKSDLSLDSLTRDYILKINNRLTGIGADQVLAIDDKNFVKIWTEDGSTISLCGNGLRCLGKLLNLPSVTLNTEGSTVELKNLENGTVSLFVQKKAIIKKLEDHYIVDIGNLHKIFFVEDNSKIDIITYANDDYIISFLSHSNNKWNIRTMESHTTKETLACGSAALAAANTLHYLGYKDLTVHFKYGSIQHLIEGDRFIQVGPATIVAEIKFYDEFLPDVE